MARHTRKRNHTRISRPLIALLGATMAVGGSVYLHNIKKTRNARADKERMSLKAVEVSGTGILPGSGSRIPPATSSGSVQAHSAAALPTPSVLVTQTPSVPATTPPPDTGKMPVPLKSDTGKMLLPLKPETGKAPAPLKPDAGKMPAPLDTGKMPVPLKPPLVEGKAKMDAGELIAARGILNAALASGHLSAADSAAARHLLSEISQTVLFSTKPFQDDPAQTLYQVKGGDRLARIAERHAVTWELLCRINGLSDPRKVRAGQWIKIPNGPFYCVITKSDYRLDVYLGSPGEAGSVFVTTLQVGLGKDNSTPTGTWIIGASGKAHPATYYSPRGEGVIAADDPKNPLGGYWMGLSGVAGNALEKSSYGIHGTIEPDSIGKQASMGCIRLRHDDIALLYDLLVESKSKVVVKE